MQLIAKYKAKYKAVKGRIKGLIIGISKSLVRADKSLICYLFRRGSKLKRERGRIWRKRVAILEELEAEGLPEFPQLNSDDGFMAALDLVRDGLVINGRFYRRDELPRNIEVIE